MKFIAVWSLLRSFAFVIIFFYPETHHCSANLFSWHHHHHHLKIFDWRSTSQNVEFMIVTKKFNDLTSLSTWYQTELSGRPTFQILEIGNIFQNNETTNNASKDKSFEVKLEPLKLFHFTNIVIFLPSNPMEFYEIFYQLHQMFNHDDGTRNPKSEWKLPNYFMIWPKLDNFEETAGSEDKKLEFLKSLQATMKSQNENVTTSLNLTIDLNIYFIFIQSSGQNLQIDPTRSQPPIKLFELYSIKYRDYYEEIPLDNYPHDDGFIKFDELQFNKLERRNQFNKIVMVGAAKDDPHLLQDDILFKKQEKVEFETGVGVEVYRNLRDMLNFTEEAMRGSSIEEVNGKASGVIIDLLNDLSADLSISQVTLMPSRAQAVAFLQPQSYGQGYRAFFKQPPVNAVRNIFWAPFHRHVWLAMIVLWAGIAVLNFVFNRLRNEGENFGLKNKSKFMAKKNDDVSVMWIWAAMCQTSWPTCPRAIAMRIIFISGFLFGLILYLAYSAAIVSVLSVRQVPIKKFSDLFSYNFLIYAHERSTTLQHFIKNDVIKLHHRSQGLLTVPTSQEVSILLAGTNAFVSAPDLFYVAATKSLNKTDEFLCEILSSIPTGHRPASAAMFLKKGSPFFETISHKMMIMRERGLQIRYRRIYNAKTQPNCPLPLSDLKDHQDSFSLFDLYFAFLFIAVGYGLAILGFLVEKAIFFLQNFPKLLVIVLNGPYLR